MQRTGAVKLGELLGRYVKEVHLENDMRARDVSQAWNAAVGPRAASVTSRTYYKDGVLYCHISSSIIRNRLYYNKDGIMAEINRRVGDGTVTAIVLR